MQEMSKQHSLQTDFPEIAKEWDVEKNAPLLPDAIGHGSIKKVSWICPRGHSYEARIDHRTIMKSGCPYCAGKKAFAGFNDLATLYPDIAREWDYKKNAQPPQAYLPKSGKSVHWICSWCDSPYEKKIVARTANKTGYPFCSKEKGTSFQEQSILFYLSKSLEVKSRYREYGPEIDVYIPSMETGIEYNGKYFHKKRKARDIKKLAALRASEIRLITIDEADENTLSEDRITIKSNTGGRIKDSDLEWGIRSLFDLLKVNCPALNLGKDQIAIKEQYIVSRKEDNFAEKYPEHAREWNPERNGTLRPENFTFGSSHIAYFDCPACDTTYPRKIADKVRGMGCPVCAGKKIKKGYNDLATTHPELVLEWSDQNKRQPDEVTVGSDKKAWWHCNTCKHEWDATISSRALGKAGCPVCAGKVVVPGYNDLETLYPQIAKEWASEGNGTYLPSQFTSGSSHVASWECRECGKTWPATISSRVRGRGCPKCGRKRAKETRISTYIKMHGSLAERYPQIAAQWDYENNSELTPNTISYGSDQTVSWRCPDCGNRWDAVISSRTVGGKGCPECGKKKCVISAQKTRLQKQSTLAEKYPEIAKQWDYTENERTPDDVTPGSKYLASWICSQGHRWKAVVYSRKKTGCPVCAGRKPSGDESSPHVV